MYSFSNISVAYVNLGTQGLARYLQRERERERERESSQYIIGEVLVCTYIKNSIPKYFQSCGIVAQYFSFFILTLYNLFAYGRIQ